MDTLEKHREKTIPVLEKDFNDKLKSVYDLRFSLRMGKLKNTSQIKELRKEMARIETIISEKRILEG
jgi:large subunit ribosomal protein L29